MNNNDGKDVPFISDQKITHFTGMAGMSLHWSPNFDYTLWQTYFPKIAAFLAPYNFNESSGNVKGWMPGHDYDETHGGSGLSRYGVSDLFYLRSPDNENAVGVIANRTYNFYTQWECSDPPFDVSTSDGLDDYNEFNNLNNQNSDDNYLYASPRVSHYQDEQLYINNLAGYPTKKYVIEYYNAWNPTVVIKTETKRNDNWNGLRLEFPATTGMYARPIVLVKVYPYKDKSFEISDNILPDSVGNAELQTPWGMGLKAPLQEEEVKVFPNPFNSYLNIKLPGSESNSTIMVYDLSGRKLLQSQSTENNTYLDLSSLQPGTYILTVLLYGDLYHFKIIKQ